MLLAFFKLLKRHPCLRSTFSKLGAETIQQIHEEQEVDWKHIDASAWSETKLYSQITQESQHPFDLEQESVMRVRLFTCSQKEHILLLTIHHIVTDVWSLEIMLSELGTLYQAEIDGVSVSLPSSNYSYSDYVRSQKKMLSGEQGEKLLSYWEEKLSGELPTLSLPTDKSRPPIQTYNGASINFEFSNRLTHQLKQLAISEDATLYMILLAAFQVLLYRYTGQEDILVGSPVTGRLQYQFRDVVGYFVNQVVLRGDLANNPSFKEFLKQIRQTVNEALTHQDYPFPLLVEKLQPHRDPSRSPIFQVSFVLQQLQKSQDIQSLFVDDIERDVDWGGLKLRPFKISQQEGQFDLTLEMIETSSGVRGVFKYNTDLFNASTIERMIDHFQSLLLGIVENPDTSVNSLNFLSESECHQLLVEWNNTKQDYPQDKSIHQLFEEQVEKTPSDIAVIFEHQQLTYQELNSQANRLAHYLQQQGVKSDTVVGICLERSIEMVVALIAVMKAGGAYMPLDPDYPQERLAFTLVDSQVSILLVHTHLVNNLPPHSAQLVCIDTDSTAFADCSLENPVTNTNPENLAYVIYTSGSTGKPKGVQIPYRAVVNFLSTMSQIPGLAKEDIMLSVTTLSFDIAALELYLPLIVGARLVLVNQEVISDGTQLLKQLSRWAKKTIK